MASVFLSYDHEDLAVARPLAVALEKAGHTVWYDRDIHGGAQYSRKIEQALDAADAVIVLWSPNSLDSAWVRDEAAEGRDRGKLVPLSIGGVKAPMGFRQFQTIDLGAWIGRGKVPRLDALLNAVHNQSGPDEKEVSSRKETRAETALARPQRKTIVAVIAAAIILLIGAGGAWMLVSRNSLPVVEVAAANNSSRSQAAASDLFVKLGGLAQIGQAKWKLVDAASAPAKPNLVFRTADLSTPERSQENVVLMDGTNSELTTEEEALLDEHNRPHRAISVIEDQLLDAIDLERERSERLPALTPREVLVLIGIENPTNPQSKECAGVLRTYLGESKRINGRDKWRVPFALDAKGNPKIGPDEYWEEADEED